MKFILFGIVALIIGQGLIWFQTNGQFLWSSWKNNPMIVSLIGWPVSYMMIYGTKWFYQGFDGAIWPGRLLGFACGMFVFGFLSHYLMNEPVTQKTIITLCLAALIVITQIFVK